MLDRDRQIDELHYELVMLKTALEFIHGSPAQDRILARINACIAQYSQLVDQRLCALIDAETPAERTHGL